MKLEESKTYENLARAFAAECQARVRYEFIEYGARYNGYKALAEIIDKIVYQEFNHARMLYTALHNNSKMPEIENINICAGYPFKEKWELVNNLRIAADDEDADAQSYAEFAKTAKEEGFDNIAELMLMIQKVEDHHKRLFLELYDQMKNKTIYKKDKKVKWICPDCGYVHCGDEAPDECPLCKAKQGSFELILPPEFASYCINTKSK